MSLKFGMKDISNPQFSNGDVTLNWLEYMNSCGADILYPGPKVKRLFSEESLDGKYEIYFSTEQYYFIRNLQTGKKQVICRTSARPANYKTCSIKDIEEAAKRADSIHTIPDIPGASNFRVTPNGVTFDVETKMYASEHSLVNLDPQLNYFNPQFRNLLVHAFIVKDISIPIKARVSVSWNRSKPTVHPITNNNKHMNVNCYGTATYDLERAIANREITRIAVLMLTALGNINLTDTGLWSSVSLFKDDSYIKYISKNGETILLTSENFRELCPKVDVDFSMVNSIIQRHQLT